MSATVVAQPFEAKESVRIDLQANFAALERGQAVR